MEIKAAHFNTAWLCRSAVQKKNLDTKPPPHGTKRASQPISNTKNAFSLASLIHIADHPKTPMISLCSYAFLQPCFFSSTVKRCSVSLTLLRLCKPLLWLLNNWMLCLGILMEGILIGVCVSGYAEKWKTSKS